MNLRGIVFPFLYLITGQAILRVAEAQTRPKANDVTQYFNAASKLMDKRCGPFGFLNCFDDRCSCYLVHESRSHFDASSKYCQNFHGHLVILSTQEESDYVASLLNRTGINDAWIGLNRSDSSAEFEWADKSAVSYSALKKDGQEGNCVRLTSQNDWIPYKCLKTATSFVCEVPFESNARKDTCRPGWAKFGNHCYQLHKEKRTWDGAQEHCECLGANLVSIHSFDERAAVRDMLRMSAVLDSWIGLRLDSITKKFNWIDGTAKDFIDWRPEQPDNFGKNEECAEVRNSDRRWNDLRCSKQRPYICKTGLSPKT